jgi:hypothetical protein
MTIQEQENEQLDRLLNQIEVPDFSGLESRVLNQSLPERQMPALDRFLDWLLPRENFGKNIWRPATAACLPLVFGIVVGNYFSFGFNLESDGFSYWEDELTMLSLNDYSETTFQ